MLQFLQTITQRKDEKGASAVEYGLLVAAIAALIVVLVFAIGGMVKTAFKETCDGMNDGMVANSMTGSSCS